jgi:glutamine synthetase
MEEEKIEVIKQKIEENEIKIVYLNFPDMNGNIRTKGVLATEILRTVHISMLDGISVSGNLIEGFETNNSWFLIVPILETFTVISWGKNDKYKAAYMLCSLKNSDMNSRNCVEKLMSIAEDADLYPMCGMPLTYEILGKDETKGNDFYKLLPSSAINKFNIHLVNVLLDAGIDIEAFIPYGKSHNGIEFVPQPVLNSIDQIELSKWIASSLAIDESLSLNFSRPMENSSPIHMSIWNKTPYKNLFFDPEDELELSSYGYSFMAGILANFDEIFAVIIGTSGKMPECKYKRSFSAKSDECILSVPLCFIEKQKKDRVGWSKRCIFRGILPETNYYLALGCVYMAGIDGIKRKLKPEQYMDETYTVFSSSIEEKIAKLERNDMFRDILGNSVLEFITSRLEKLR